jgi:anti-sigma factor RsiW
MLGCHNVSEDLTAWLDGQLPRRQHERIRLHITQCARCAAEVNSLGAAIAWQQHALPAVSALDGVDTSALKVKLRYSMAKEADGGVPVWGLHRVWTSMWGRLALAGAAAAVVAIVFLLAGGPGMVLMPLGLESPPPAVARQTELFKEYPLIERLDVLEHFDTVESVPLDDDSASKRG